jgi:hypothetical protein
MGGEYASGSIHSEAVAHHSGLCCEARLGLRLVGRLVPVRVYPFHFTGAGGAAAVYGAGKLSKTVTC